MPEVTPLVETFARIKVIGIGGAGGAAINRMIEAGVHGATNANGIDMVAALFVDSTAGALAAATRMSNSGASPGIVTFAHTVSAASTSARTPGLMSRRSLMA